ncbi:hypothetical protein F4810DRAFT_648977 [Camillea tinctor]|nr:hypothetical protein F4810DRAFT_648977 [Camillea tinctor]
MLPSSPNSIFCTTPSPWRSLDKFLCCHRGSLLLLLLLLLQLVLRALLCLVLLLPWVGIETPLTLSTSFLALVSCAFLFGEDCSFERSMIPAGLSSLLHLTAYRGTYLHIIHTYIHNIT